MIVSSFMNLGGVSFSLRDFYLCDFQNLGHNSVIALEVVGEFGV